jgi:hypothetical protein
MQVISKINGAPIITKTSFNETAVGNLVGATNGLQADGSIVKLGGQLTEDTVITPGTKNLKIDGPFNVKLGTFYGEATSTVPTIQVSNTAPQIELQNTGSAQNAKRWNFYAYDNTFVLRALADGGLTSANGNILSTNRNGSTITNLTLGSPVSAMTIPSLAGNGTRMVVAGQDGTLTTQAIPTPTDNVTASNGLTQTGSNIKLGGTVSESTTINVSNFLHLTGNYTYAPNMFIGQVASDENDAVYPLMYLNSGQIFVVDGGGTVSFNLPEPNKPMIFHFIASEKALFFIGQQNTMTAKIRYVDATQYYNQISNVKSLTPITPTRAACSIVAVNGEWQVINVTGTWYDAGNNPIK